MAREIKITAAFVDYYLIQWVSEYLMYNYGGYTRTEGFGGYTKIDGSLVEEIVVTWVVATGDSKDTNWWVIEGIAQMYCRLGKQESIYFVDAEGECWIVFADGHHEAIK